MKQDVFLLCNAHLDPVWQWEWPVGLAETLSTFRIAANFCEEYDGFVFNHNEALLYRWVEEYDPVLFARIQRLVRQKKWHIMGGWYLQPDCVMSCGESLSRQIAFGRKYFKEKFDVEPSVAVNVDSFGHDRGLVQLLVKNGYTGYLIGRPPCLKDGEEITEFIWHGYNGTAIKVHNSSYHGMYSSFIGKSVEKFTQILQQEPDNKRLMILWGVGNHGGGPSKIDLDNIKQWTEENKDLYTVKHSTPEEYFEGLNAEDLPHISTDLGPIMVGCYTSQQNIKQLHAELENTLLQTEKICAAAHYQAGVEIPQATIAHAEETLLFNEFHDVLPGSSIRDAETSSLQVMGGAIEALKKAKTNAFIRMTANLPVPPQDTIPIIIYNPHPWSVKTVAECEFMLAGQNRADYWTDFDVYDGGTLLPSQLLKENSNIPIDWSKRLAIDVELEPFNVKQLIAYPKKLAHKPVITQPEGEWITMSAADGTEVAIDRNTGYIAFFTINGKSVLDQQAGKLLVIEDDEDPWGMLVSSFEKEVGCFALASAEYAGELAGLSHSLCPVRLIEDGPLRMAVESVLVYEQSHAVVTYILEKATGVLKVDIRLGFMQANKMVKWALPSGFSDAKPIGQGVFGHKDLYDDGTENVAQRWLAMRGDEQTVTVINRGVYGSSFKDGVLYQTLVRTPVHCAHPVDDRQVLPNDRCLPHVDMGIHDYSFLLKAGAAEERLEHVEREAQLFNEEPMVMSVFTAGNGEKTLPSFITLDNPLVTLTSCRKTQQGLQMRLFNQTEMPQVATLVSETLGKQQEISLSPCEFLDIIW